MGTAATGQGETYLASFLQRLEELRWVQGRNISTNVRWWAGGPEQMRTAVAEQLAFSPDVFMVWSNLALELLKPMAGKVPIVFAGVGDPLGSGFVASLARPGGNITGFVSIDGPMGGKWREVLKETAPHLRRVMAILHPDAPPHRAFWNSIKEAAPRLGVEVIPGAVHDAAGIDSAISSFAMQENGGIIVLQSASTGPTRISLSRWDGGIACLRFTPAKAPSRPAGSSPMGSTSGIIFARAPNTSIAFCVARSRAIFRCSNPPSSNSRSTLRPPKRWASQFRRQCSPALTR